MSDRLEVPASAGEWAVVVTFMPIERLPLGYWHHTWTYRAAEHIKGQAIRSIHEHVTAEGDGLYGHGGRVHVRLEGEPEYPPAPVYIETWVPIELGAHRR